MGTSMLNDKDHVAKNEATETTPIQANSIVITQLVPKNGIEAAADDGRETWGQKMDFLLSVIGFAVDLANVWRFPYLCFKNGGGAFLIPYFSMLLVGGIPLFYMELALGQFYRTGAITCWARVCPIAKGIGWAVVLIAFYTDFFYNVVIAWSLHFFFASFTADLPWTTCGNEWNTKNCFDIFGTDDLNDNASDFGDNMTLNSITNAEMGSLTYFAGNGTNFVGKLLVNGTNSTIATDISKRTLPAAEYFERKMLELHKSGGIFEVGEIKWQMVLCLLGVYIICYFSLWKGIKMSGKVVWFTALFPYVVLTVLMIRGATLPGAADGVRYYLTPDFSRLKNSEVWVDAATQVFFSLGPGFGVLLAFASYNPIHNNVYKDALITSAVNCGTSFMSGFVIFMILGYMSVEANVPIQKVATEGPGLVFIVYPAAIATLPGATFWAIMFFLMLLTLGLDSSFGGSEAIITAVSDEFPVIGRHREIFVALLFTLYFVVGLAFCTQGGAYVVRLMDAYAAGYSILFAVLCETVAISWVYGVERFSRDIHMMLGFKPGVYWRVCWKFIAPVFICFIMIFGLVFYHPLDYDDYQYPLAANIIGWTIACSSILCIPLFAVVQIYRAEGTLLQRIRFLLKPARDTTVDEIRVSCNDVSLAGDHLNADHV